MPPYISCRSGALFLPTRPRPAPARIVLRGCFTVAHKRARLLFYLAAPRIRFLARAGFYQSRLALASHERQSRSLSLVILRHLTLLTRLATLPLIFKMRLPRAFARELVKGCNRLGPTLATFVRNGAWSRTRPARLKRKISRRLIIYGFYMLRL